VKSYDPGNLPAIGSEKTLTPDDKNEASITVRVRKSFGIAEIMGVTDEHGQSGIAAFQPDGSWWWIRKIDPRDPWSGDPDAWKRDSTGG
jgi:hypothetical protein